MNEIIQFYPLDYLFIVAEVGILLFYLGNYTMRFRFIGIPTPTIPMPAISLEWPVLYSLLHDDITTITMLSIVVEPYTSFNYIFL